MNPSVQHNAKPNPRVKKVYYTGTDQLAKGYALCYDQDASPTDAADEKRLGRAVEKPATANLNAFAGIVAAAPPGPGPCFVDIYPPEPGEFIEAFTDADMTAFTTVLGPQNGSYALAAKTDATFNLAAVAKAAQTVNTDTTNANAWVQFL